VFGFLGPNGAGKTTTINMITTLLKPTGGRITITGKDVIRDSKEVRSVIGLVPQDLTVDDELTGRENMVLHGDLYHVPRSTVLERTEELLDLVGLSEAADRMVGTYSGGMRKRLELAEGLINRPKVLFLDEPTLGLDIQTRTVLWDYIEMIRKENDTTIFLTTHYLEEADRLCDRIAIIDNGKVVAMDTPEALKRSLGGDIVELTMDHQNGIGPELEELEGVIEIKETDKGYRIKAEDGESLVPDLVRAVYDKGGQIRSVNVTRPNLDQVFLEYTGRSLRDTNGNGKADKGQRMGRNMMARRRH
jgi:ABC-2 type transport system ATP-binding protein